MLLTDFLLTAKHVTPHVRTEEDFRRQQLAIIKKNMAAYRHLPWRLPWRSPDQPLVRVDGGRWMVTCTTEGCFNGLVVAPDWNGLALCAECGAIYEGLQMPPEAADIERLLIKRRRLSDRFWLPGGTVEQLAAENRAAGIED